MARPAKDNVIKRKPMSFTIDKSSLILWKLLDCSRSNFIAAMLQYAVKDEKLRDIFYGKNGINDLKAFKLIEDQEERRWQEFFEKASELKQTIKEPEVIDEPKGKDIVEDKKVEAIDELESEDIEDDKSSEILPIKKLKKVKEKKTFN